jgi:hypothetical protein
MTPFFAGWTDLLINISDPFATSQHFLWFHCGATGHKDQFHTRGDYRERKIFEGTLRKRL